MERTHGSQDFHLQYPEISRFEERQDFKGNFLIIKKHLLLEVLACSAAIFPSLWGPSVVFLQLSPSLAPGDVFLSPSVSRRPFSSFL